MAKLSEICDLINDKIKLNNCISENLRETYVSTENMLQNKAGITTPSSIPSVGSITAYKENDTLVSNIRPYFKKIWKATSCGGCSNDVLVFRAKDGISADFLYYLLADDRFFDYSMQTSKGTKMPRGDKKAILEYTVSDLDFVTQKKATIILSLIDRKIAVNNTINDNLLEQASTLFNSVIQQSTSVVYAELGSLADVKGGKRLPKGVNLVTAPNQHPYIRVRDLNNAVFASLSNDYEYVDDETQQSISRYIVSTGDLLISIVGTIGLTAIVDHTLNKANLTENCVKLTNLKKVTPEYLLLFLRSSQGAETMSKGTVGAVQLKLPIKNIQSIAVPLLCDEELLPLNETLSAIFSQISANIVEMKQLVDIRDALLPKLMSGEIEVSNIEI